MNSIGIKCNLRYFNVRASLSIAD